MNVAMTQPATAQPTLADAPVVSCRGITKSFGEGDSKVMALRGVDLTIYAGEVMMLVGPSGCGKTTLISIMAGILKQDGGSCEILGQPINQLADATATRFRAKNIGFIFQSYNLLPALTLTENVAVPLIINGMDHRQAEKLAEDMLYEVGLGGRLESTPSQLSGGQQQRVAIARAGAQPAPGGVRRADQRPRPPNRRAGDEAHPQRGEGSRRDTGHHHA